MQEQKQRTLKEEVNNFIFNWHNFPIDYWWRKKYKVPFGSPKHRSMNFFDMLIDFEEELLLIKDSTDKDYDDLDKDFGFEEKGFVKASQEEIDEDYENLELEDNG